MLRTGILNAFSEQRGDNDRAMPSECGMSQRVHSQFSDYSDNRLQIRLMAPKRIILHRERAHTLFHYLRWDIFWEGHVSGVLRILLTILVVQLELSVRFVSCLCVRTMNFDLHIWQAGLSWHSWHFLDQLWR